MYYDYLGLDSDYTYQEHSVPSFTPSVTNVEGTTTIVTTINGGGGGQVSGNVTVSGGVTGFTFTGNGSTLLMSGVVNVASGGTGAGTAAAARTNLEAAKSGVNADITMFTGLSGVGGWAAWTGSPDKTSHATYAATADALYNQAQIQALMDKVKELSEALKALLDTHLGSGVIEL